MFTQVFQINEHSNVLYQRGHFSMNLHHYYNFHPSSLSFLFSPITASCAHNSLHSGQYGGVFTSLLSPPLPASAAGAALAPRGVNVAFHDPRHVQLHPGGVAVHAGVDMPLKTPGSDSGIWMDAEAKHLQGKYQKTFNALKPVQYSS